MDTIVKTRNGNLISVKGICASTADLKKKVFDGENYIELGSLRPSQLWKRITKLDSFMPRHSLFRKI